MAGDVDYYAFDAVGGRTLVAEILTGQLDTMMALFDSAGTEIAFNDDSNGLLSAINVEIPADGTYYLAVTTWPDDDFDGTGGNTDPISGQGRYVLDAFLIDGLLLDLGDDDSENVGLDFSFPFNGADYDRCLRQLQR